MAIDANLPQTFKAVMKPYEEMLKAGKYDRINESVTAHFPVTNLVVGQEVEISFVSLGHSSMNEEVLAELDKRGLRPATLVEIVALVATFPKTLSTAQIVALGSVWIDSTGCRVSPLAYIGTAGNRNLSVDWNDESNMWLENTLFAAVRK